ncbi:uncharacterized protein K452DRAFT_210419, partial [Aplosporella prunicola CBS 121167]
ARRTFFTDALPTVLIPPTMFLMCFVGLWSYKILMTIVFQEKLIYLPYLPPFARSEKIDEYAKECKPVEWEEKRIRSLDGTRISLCVGRIPQGTPHGDDVNQNRRHVVLVYFQGNGASLPPRLPALSGVLRTLARGAGADAPEYTIVALSYRGFWTSKGKASEKGIQLDARAALAWVEETYHNHPDTRMILWGQSLGAGVAANLAAHHLELAQQSILSKTNRAISGVILETPFISIKEMLLSLYPQKWLPYRYLWPFLRNHWDNDAALKSIATKDGGKRFPIMIMQAAEDEVVPMGQADHLQHLCQELQLDVRRRDVPGALHMDTTTKQSGRDAIVGFVKEVEEKR